MGKRIQQIMSYDLVANRYFIGVYSADLIPLNDIPHWRPVMFVANTAPSNHRGIHWVAFFYPREGPPEFFDSFGRSPAYYRLTFQKYKCNKKVLQSHDSSVCGYYVLLYLLQRIRGYSMEEITGQFTKNRDANDMAVVQLMEEYTLF